MWSESRAKQWSRAVRGVVAYGALHLVINVSHFLGYLFRFVIHFAHFSPMAQVVNQSQHGHGHFRYAVGQRDHRADALVDVLVARHRAI